MPATVLNHVPCLGPQLERAAFAPAPDAGEATGYYRQLSRYSSAFALCADMALLTLGGALKRKEMLSARSATSSPNSICSPPRSNAGRTRLPEARLCRARMVHGERLQDHREPLCGNPGEPSEPFVAIILKFLIQPFGARVLGPSDRVVHQCAQLVLEPTAARDRLTADLAFVEDDGGIARLEKAFRLVTAAEDIEKQMRAARLDDPGEAVKKGVITQGEAEKLVAAHEAVKKVIEVDDFAPDALSPTYKKPAGVHQFFQELGEQRAAS